MFMLAAGAAALAVSTAPALAQPEGKGKPEKAERGGGKPDKARGNDRGNAKQEMRAQRGNGQDRVQAHGNDDRRGPPVREARGNGNRGNGNGNAVLRVDGGPDIKVKGNGKGRGNDVVRVAGRDLDVTDFFRYGSGTGLVDGCPPGLAKKNNGCLPPGQAKQLWGQRAEQSLLSRVLMGPYQTWYGDRDGYRYRMDDRYIYRIGSDGLIGGLIPLFDRPGYYYPVGSRYPDAYNFYNVPYQYRSAYDDDYYRYGDGAIYRIDPTTQIIQGVAALLTGDMTVGQPMPNRYSTYNVPYSYRDQYYDRPDSMYRYSDGYIYRVDPTTMLVAEAIKAII
ncbi:hypothetical protein [Sphingomicrobium flavum]|uniref:hypothetical protein n=1 Tax=Sphingomicrobium flavum TaxID=1229164 RepID=UPI0021AD9B13|nr:hypothetical protein [Sphingomicrobium flavum]